MALKSGGVYEYPVDAVGAVDVCVDWNRSTGLNPSVGASASSPNSCAANIDFARLEDGSGEAGVTGVAVEASGRGSGSRVRCGTGLRVTPRGGSGGL